MNLFKIGQELQKIKQSVHEVELNFLGGNHCKQSMPFEEVADVSQVSVVTSGISCIPDNVVYGSFSNPFKTSLRAMTIISNVARGVDYIVATVSSVEPKDKNGNPLGVNMYLADKRLQSMLQLAHMLTEALGETNGVVDLLYGSPKYFGNPIPIIFGIQASWNNPSTSERSLTSLSAEIVSGCDIKIRATLGDGTIFRAGSQHTLQKLDALALAYYLMRVRNKELQEIDLNGDVLIRMQLAT